MINFFKYKDIKNNERTNTIFRYIITMIILLIPAIICLAIYLNRNDRIFVKYNQNSDIDYKVHLKENAFFNNEYLESNKQYIASLINNIIADFNYKLSIEEKNIDYKYSYKIDAVVTVVDDNTENILYTNSKVILEEKEYITNNKEIEINENLTIDYNQYNDLISNFVSVYDLKDATSVLNINMHVKINSLSNSKKEIDEKESIISLSIPLTTKTIAIDLSNNLVNNKNNLLRYKEATKNYLISLILAILLLLIDLILGIILMIYITKTRNNKTIYERKVKKILNNYGSYIQPLDNDISFEGYQLLEINSFNDMLEIRDTIRQPILMRENKDKTGILFMIPNNAKILYIYRLRMVDINKKKT